MSRSFSHALAMLLVPALSACASSVTDVRERAVRDELELVEWRLATAADVAGHWRARSLEGPAAAVLLDLAYWLGADGEFTGAALFAGPPPEYRVLSGRWTLGEDGALRLGDDAEPARAEAAPGLLRLGGAEGRIVLERAEVR